MTITEIYEKFHQIGSVAFSTIDNNGYVQSRIAHFFAHDSDGLYFRTMFIKPFYTQLKAQNTVSVCGMYPSTNVVYDENGLPYFQPGYTIRISGDCKELSLAEVQKKGETNEDFRVALHDIDKYPATRIFVLHRAQGELYDFDFEHEHRDHKLLRESFCYGDMVPDTAGVCITDNCVACGACYKACTFNAIEKGKPYKIIENRCDECGNCYVACKFNAILTREEKLVHKER